MSPSSDQPLYGSKQEHTLEEIRLLPDGDGEILHSFHRNKSRKCRSNNSYVKHCFAFTCILASFVFLRDIFYPMEEISRRKFDMSSMDAVRSSLRTPLANNQDKKLHVAMLADHVTKSFCQSLFSQLANGYDAPHLMSFGHKPDHGNADKMFRAQDHLAALANKGEDSVVMFIDAFDIAFQLPKDILYDRFQKFDMDLVISAEKNCYPYREDVCPFMKDNPIVRGAYGGLTNADVEHTAPRYLNSGLVMARNVEKARVLYEESVKLSSSDPTNTGDQHIVSRLAVNGTRFRARNTTYTLDYRSELAFNMFRGAHDITWEVNPNGQSPSSTPPSTAKYLSLMDHVRELGLHSISAKRTSFWLDRPLARNKIANTLPVLLHYNGDKEFFPSNFEKMWFTQPDVKQTLLTTFTQDSGPGKAGAWSGDEWLPWPALCSSQM